jgi:hypothetical protein
MTAASSKRESSYTRSLSSASTASRSPRAPVAPVASRSTRWRSKAASQDLGKHLRAPQRGKHSGTRLPEPFDDSKGALLSRLVEASVARSSRGLSSIATRFRLNWHDAFQHHDHRYDKFTPGKSGGDDALQLCHANRQAITGTPGCRNDAFQQHDPRAPTRGP